VLQFGRHEITREVTERGVVCRKEVGQNVPQDAKIETTDTYWVQGKGTVRLLLKRDANVSG